MRQSYNKTSSVSGAGVAQAFCGLGFDLKRVVSVALCMTAKWAGKPVAGDVTQPVFALVPRPAGYELLVSLGREIRGR